MAPPTDSGEEAERQRGQDRSEIGRAAFPRRRRRSMRRRRPERRTDRARRCRGRPASAGARPRIRINAQAANASIQDTSPPVIPTTRRHTTRSRKTVRCPTSVAAVRTCQRRRRSSSAPERNRASPSPPQVTGPRRTRRNTRFVSRATRAPIHRARSALESASAKATIAMTRTARPMRAAVRSAG